MLRQRLTKLNQAGFDHVLLGVFIVVIFAVIGTAFLVLGHGASWSGELYLGTNHSVCLDNNGGSSASKNKVDVYSCNGSPAQNWSIISIASNRFLLQDKAGTCLDDKGDGGSGATVQTYTCNKADHAQVFEWQNSQLQNAYKAVCINDPAYNTKNGTGLIMYACNGTSNEQWFEASQSSGGGGNSGGGAGFADYKNPLRSASYTNGRIDQGVDYNGSGPIYAIGTGKIEGSTTGASWPGGVFIRYQLTTGIASGVYIYVAEDCTPTISLRDGTPVTANTKICNMFNGSTGIETGFAQSPSHGWIAMAYNEYQGHTDGLPTNFGVLFSAFMRAIGAPGGSISKSTGGGSTVLSSTPIPVDLSKL